MPNSTSNNNSTNNWIVTVEEDPATGELLLPFPPDLLSQMGWSEGTDIWWDIKDDGKIYITDHDPKEKKSGGTGSSD